MTCFNRSGRFFDETADYLQKRVKHIKVEGTLTVDQLVRQFQGLSELDGRKPKLLMCPGRS